MSASEAIERCAHGLLWSEPCASCQRIDVAGVLVTFDDRANPVREAIMRALFGATFPRLGQDLNPLTDRVYASVRAALSGGAA